MFSGVAELGGTEFGEAIGLDGDKVLGEAIGLDGDEVLGGHVVVGVVGEVDGKPAFVLQEGQFHNLPLPPLQPTTLGDAAVRKLVCNMQPEHAILIAPLVSNSKVPGLTLQIGGREIWLEVA